MTVWCMVSEPRFRSWRPQASRLVQPVNQWPPILPLIDSMKRELLPAMTRPWLFQKDLILVSAVFYSVGSLICVGDVRLIAAGCIQLLRLFLWCKWSFRRNRVATWTSPPDQCCAASLFYFPTLRTATSFYFFLCDRLFRHSENFYAG